jgi:AcrR family transcriptional regulator
VRQRIIDAARPLFLSRGVLDVSMDDVALAAGLTKRTVYKHLDTKEKLLEAIVEASHAQAEALFSAALASAAPFADRLRGIFSALVSVHRASTPQFFIELEQEYPALGRRMAQNRKKQIGRLVDALRTAQKNGDARADVPAPLALELLLTSINHVRSVDTLKRSEVSQDQALQAVFELFLSGILN